MVTEECHIARVPHSKKTVEPYPKFIHNSTKRTALPKLTLCSCSKASECLNTIAFEPRHSIRNHERLPFQAVGERLGMIQAVDSVLLAGFTSSQPGRSQSCRLYGQDNTVWGSTVPTWPAGPPAMQQAQTTCGTSACTSTWASQLQSSILRWYSVSAG